MARKESEGGQNLLRLGLFACAISLCRCASVAGLQALDHLKESSNPRQEQAQGTLFQHHGRLLIGQNQNHNQQGGVNGTRTTEDFLDVGADVQADMGEWAGSTQQTGQMDLPMQDMATVQRLLQLEPKVECTVDSMMLQLHDAASTPLFFVDRGYRLPPLPLSKLPSSCGYDIRSTHRDLVLVAPYDGCFVAHEADSYVLPLRWWGIPLRVSCPLIKQPSSNPPMVTCHAEGMVVTTEWNIPASKIQVHVNGNWEPLLKASHRCRFSVVEHPEGVVISIHYVPCIDKKDELYTLELSGDGETKITCPSLLVAPPPVRKNLTAPSNPEFGYTSYPTHQKPDASQIPENFYQTPLMQNENPNPEQQNGGRSHLAYYIFHPRFLDSKPLAHDSPPTELSKTSLSTMPTIQAIQDPRGQMFYHFPFLPPPQESPPTYNPPSDNSGEHFYPSVLPQKSVDVPATLPGTPEQQQQIAHFLFYHPQQAPHPPPLEVPLPPHQYPEKSPVKPEPWQTFSKMPPVKGNTQTLQPEAANGPVHHRSYPFNPQQKSPINPTTFLAPQNQAPNGGHYPINPKAWDQEFSFSQPAFPQRTVLQPFQTNIQPVGMSEVENSQGHVRPLSHSSHRKPKPEVQPSETSIVNPRSHKGEHQEVQLHQPTLSYPTLPSENQPEWNSPTKPAQRPCELSKGANDRKDDERYPTETLETRRTQQEQTYHLQVPQQPQTPAAYLVVITHQPVPPPFSPADEPDSLQSPVPVQYVPCPQFCPTGFPNCCPQIAFHQHLHQVFPVFTESKDAPAFYVNPLVLHPVVYSDTSDGLEVPPVALKLSEATSSSTTQPSLPVVLLPLPPGDFQQQYSPEGYPPSQPMSNLSMSEKKEPWVYSHFRPDSSYQHWTYSPQHHQYKGQQPPLASEPLALDSFPVNQIVQQEAQNVPFPRSQHALHHEGAASPDVLLFIDQYLKQQRNQPTAVKQTFNKNPTDLQSLTRLDNKPGHDRFLVPYGMLQDSPVAVDTNNFKLKSPMSDSKKNSSKPNQKLEFYSEKKRFAVQHVLPGSQHLSFNDSLKSFRDVVQELHKNAQNQDRNHGTATPKDKNSNIAQTQISPSNWLGGENSDPVPGHVNYMQRNDGGAHSPPSNRRQIVIKSQDQLKVEHPESQRDFWKSLLLSGPGQSVPPHVPGKTVQRRNTMVAHRAMGLNKAPLAESGSEKHR